MRRSLSSLALRAQFTATKTRSSYSPHKTALRPAIPKSRSIYTSPKQQPRPANTSNSTVRHYSSTMSNNDSTATLKVVSYELLDELRSFWFEHIEDEERIILPDMPSMKRFFAGGEDFDTACTKKFSPALEEIKAQGITSADTLLNLLPPRKPLDWLAWLLLLDQIPRNCYRNEVAGQVFTFFDPLALGIALKALDERIFFKSPTLRWNFIYRIWLNLPLVHSERIEIHDRIDPEILVDLRADVEALLSNSSDRDDGSEERKKAAVVLQKRTEEANFIVKSQAESEEQHVSILRRFGRYPHRNGPLGRTMTPEEDAYLKEGGLTFAPPKSDEEMKKWEGEKDASKQ